MTLVVKATATAPGLLLRPWEDQDVDAMIEAHRDPLIRRWLRHPITSVEQARKVIEVRQAAAQAQKNFSFAILEMTAHGNVWRLAGGVGIRRRVTETSDAGTSPTDTAEVGYWVAAPARGRGVASRALEGVCQWAFDEIQNPPLTRLELIHSIGNHPSCRVAQKTGFALSAVLPPLPPDFPDDGHLHVRARLRLWIFGWLAALTSGLLARREQLWPLNRD